MKYEDVDPESILGQAIAPYLDKDIYVAPVLGVNFVEPWVVYP